MPPDLHTLARHRMLNDQLRARNITNPAVLSAMLEVPRHLFLPDNLHDRAYADEALPTSDNQTISQPYIVALMTQELDLHPGMSVLELGTGTGYQTAILSHIVGPAGRIFTIERIPNLAASAQQRLTSLALPNIISHTGDGSAGWPPHLWPFPTPILFDRILTTAAAPKIPAPLLAQLKPHGILIIPLGTPDSQTLRRITKSPTGTLHESGDIQCRFVPLLGKFAWTPPAD